MYSELCHPCCVIQSDSLAKVPKLLSIKYVNQLTDDELTTGYYQQDGATCHTYLQYIYFELVSFVYQILLEI